MTHSFKAAAILALALVALSPVANAAEAGTKVETTATTTETKSVHNGVAKHHMKKAAHKKVTAVRKAMPKAVVKTDVGAKVE